MVHPRSPMKYPACGTERLIKVLILFCQVCVICYMINEVANCFPSNLFRYNHVKNAGNGLSWLSDCTSKKSKECLCELRRHAPWPRLPTKWKMIKLEENTGYDVTWAIFFFNLPYVICRFRQTDSCDVTLLLRSSKVRDLFI